MKILLILFGVVTSNGQLSIDWPPDYDASNLKARNILGRWLLTGSSTDGTYPDRKVEFEGYDGWYNNMARPDSGAIDRPLLRRSPATYEDSTYAPYTTNRPNPFTLSEKLLKGDIGTHSKTGKNALLLFFGQQVVEEILDAQRPACPPEYFNIPIPEEHYYFNQTNHTEMPFLRTRYDQRTGYSPNNPRQQLNEITPYIDGGLFYGITKQWSDQLRTYENGSIDENGCLASSFDGLFPAYNKDRLPMANPPPPFYHAAYITSHETANVSRFFKLGNPRGNENAFLLTFGVMWFRWHNYLARIIREIHGDWSSERVYNEARKWVIATQQKIVVYDWLPKWLGDSLPNYETYDASIDPQIDQLFQTAAFRFGHTLVVPGVYLRDYIRNGCKFKFDTWKQNAVRTCNIFWRGQEPLTTKVNETTDEIIDIDRLLMGMSVQLTEREDHIIVEDLRGNVFGPLEFPRRDLMAINVQRGRDHGIPDYNTARELFDLPRQSFDDIQLIVNKSYVDDLKILYDNSTDKIDLWIGGIMETDTGPGPLFKAIIKDQFRRIRDGDRFWFENYIMNKLFTKEEVERIKAISLYDILIAVTKMNKDDIPMDPFSVPTENNTLVDRCKLHTTTIGTSTYYHLPILGQDALNESCKLGTSYDYFRNSEVSYILTFAFTGAAVLGAIGVGYILIIIKERERQTLNIQENQITRSTFKNDGRLKQYSLFVVFEWVSSSVPLRRVVLILKTDSKNIEIRSNAGTIFRSLEFSNIDKPVDTYQINDAPYLILKCPHSYDLVISFESEYLRDNFLQAFDMFLNSAGLSRAKITNYNLKSALKEVVTKDHRQLLLEKFYRVVFAQVFKIKHSTSEMLKVDSSMEKEINEIQLSISEFADSLNMRSNDEFVMRMFHLIDKDKNGFISFREFVGLLIVFADGNEEQRAKLLFDMYDVDGVGYLTEATFNAMIKSFLATVGGKIDEVELQRTIKIMMNRAGVMSKDKLYFEDFLKMCGDEVKNLGKATLNFKGARKTERNSYLETARDTIQDIYMSRRELEERFQGEVRDPEADSSKIIDDEQAQVIKRQTHRDITKLYAFLRFIELKSSLIFWLTLYTLVLLAIFAERAYYYSVEREHSGLRQIAGYGVTVTRGAASAMMFTYASLLVTMCRNIITILRDTPANKFFPFDDSIPIHKYIAVWAFVFTVLHIVGHAFNFYHISTQTSDDLTCLFRNYFHATHEIPKFHYWCWQTITGFTGILLTLIWAVIYIFAQNIVRKKIYNWFWYTHSLYPLFYFLMILHGVGRLIQPPFFYYFFLGPVILYAIDSLISVGRRKVEIPVLKAEILPSNVTMLEFRKPENFQYKSGQWARIACLALNKNEFHPFTFSSAPDEKNLTFHIRAVGPWTTLIRHLYDDTNKSNSSLPKLYLDGPYGQGHQDWNQYDVAVLIGGGIGVTPFASILKDVVFKSHQTRCKKVYFIWVSRTQKQFEWLVDIIRELEYADQKNLISCHIFITQFFEKFDLRTIFLYICERHYQRISNRSLFTNLKAVTHFGRPDFSKFLKTVTSIHQNARTVGVFSCGPPAMTSSVDIACNKMNISETHKFEHHFKNF